MSLIIFTVLLSFCVLSISYVYLYRGEARYANFTEYLRKGWPISTPLNCFLYLFTKPKAKKPIIDIKDFPDLKILEDNWEVIRDEVMKLHANKHLEQTNNPENAAYYDLGFRTFYKYGWSKFYLNWYGYTHKSAIKHCPKTVELLKKAKSVNGAMFSILPVGSKLTRHLDPVACSLRYHLGLKTPNSDDCFINVDNNQYSWRDGEAFLFDETYLHFAQNNSKEERLILMCDVERPLSFIGKIFNFFYKTVLRLSVVPNMEGDKKGLFNNTFSSISPLIAKVRLLKETNMMIYKTIKYSVNFVLALLLLGLIYLLITFVSGLL